MPRRINPRSRQGRDAPDAGDLLLLDREAILRLLSELQGKTQLSSLKAGVTNLRDAVTGDPSNAEHLRANGDGVALKRDVLVAELDQILSSRTIDRARYYVRRLSQGLTRVRTSKVNDINLLRWKEYSEVLTDSLWVFPRRDSAGSHLGWYWGNFVPQIPRQLMLRYTRKGDLVLDPFCGSGTTLIECRRLGRHGLGVELNPDVAERARQLVRGQPNPSRVKTRIAVADARTPEVARELRRLGRRSAQMILMHPPYHDIIRFSDEGGDLSAAPTTDAFLAMFGEVVDNLTPLLEKGRYMGLVIGDKYTGGEWIPLGFSCMNEVLKRGYSLKSVVVKNFEETRAKRDQKQLWRYRALAGGFYIFKHEYIFVFRKR